MDPSPSPSISTPTLPTAPPAGQLGGLSKMQQEPPTPAGLASIDGLPIEAASNKPSSSRPIPQSRYSIYQRGEKDIVPDLPVSRTDSVDSYATSFRQSRTDTTWSSVTTASISTECTEPPSPDAEHASFDEPMIFDDAYASHPRPIGRHSRTVTFQGSGLSRTSSFADQDNCRPPHYSSSPDNHTPLPRQLQRLQDRASSPRRGILRSTTGINPSNSRPARRESNQWASPLPYRPRPRRTIDSTDRPSVVHDSPELPTPTEPNIKTEDDTSEGNMLQKIEPVAEDVELSSLRIDDTQVEQDPHEEVHMSDSSESAGDIDTPSSTGSSSKPDDQLVQEACDHLLKNVFGVDLQELGDTGAASDAYDSVNYCLDELSHIVPTANSMNQVHHSGAPLREVPNHGNTRAGNNTPIQAGNGGDYSGYQVGGNGNSNGNSNGNGNANSNGNGHGGNKRPPDDDGNPNDGGGGKGLGDRGNGGGGKRPKTAQEPTGEDQKLSCPFRKRNPVKFNVRDHQSCAVQSFPDISQLKRHVKNFHKQKSVSVFACPRCKQDMFNKEGLENHLHVPSSMICNPQEAPPVQNPEDGITSRIEDVLNGRKANTKVDTWDVLWPTLFPQDGNLIPDSHFVPPVELDEVLAQFRTSFEDLETRIRAAEKTPGAAAQSLEERITRIFETCTDYIESVIASSRIQADNAPGRPRRIRSGNGPNPRSTAASPKGQKTSSRHLSLPQEIQPQPISMKRHSDSSLSSSIDTANSVDSWAKVEQVIPGHHDDGHDGATTGNMSMQSLSHYTGLAIDTGDVMNADMDDPLSAISAINTGSAGSPAHLISPMVGQTGPVIPPPPPQAHLRNTDEHEFQVGSNGGQFQSPAASLMGSQLHHSRGDSGVAGFDTTTPSYYRPIPAYQNNGNMTMNMYPSNPNAFQAMSTTMGVYPTSQIHAPMQMQQMQMRYRQQTVPGNMSGGVGGTIDPRVIQHNFPNIGSMGMGSNCNNGNGYNGFSPGGSDGAN